MQVFLQFQRAGATLLCSAQASHCCGARALQCAGFSSCALRLRVTTPRLQSTGSVVVAHGLSCSEANGIFPNQGLNSVQSVQFCHSVLSDSATPWTAEHQASLSIINSRSLLKLMSIESVMPSNHLILCCTLLLIPSIFPSIRVFSNESVLRISWPKYWSFSFSTNPSNEYSGLISFRMDWFDLLAVQRTLRSLLQHHSSTLQRSAFFIVQPSHPYMTTGKTIALTTWTFVM